MNKTPTNSSLPYTNLAEILRRPIVQSYSARESPFQLGFNPNRQMILKQQTIQHHDLLESLMGDREIVGGFWQENRPKLRGEVSFIKQIIDVQEQIMEEKRNPSLDSSDNLLTNNREKSLEKIPFFMTNYRDDNMDIQIPQQQNYHLQPIHHRHLPQQPSPQNVNTDIVFTKQEREKKQKIAKLQQIGCNCRKSKCLKMYCQCFHLQIFCNQNCNCIGCGNVEPNNSHNQAVIEALTRNPRAFDEENPQTEGRFKLQVGLAQVKKGCRCKKTKCMKKYCECFNSGIPCGIFCKCQGCENCKN